MVHGYEESIKALESHYEKGREELKQEFLENIKVLSEQSNKQKKEKEEAMEKNSGAMYLLAEEQNTAKQLRIKKFNDNIS